MPYNEIVETRVDYRAVIELDYDAQPPDGDFFGTVIYLDYYGRADVQAHAYGVAADDFGLGGLWDRYRDMDMIARYLRMFEDVQGVDWFDTQDGKFVNVVTRADLDLWGRADLAGKPSDEVCKGNLDEWRSFVDGDVWGVRVEKRVTWTTEDEDFDDRDEWESLPDSETWGYYGEQWARESALDMLDCYAEAVAA